MIADALTFGAVFLFGLFMGFALCGFLFPAGLPL